MAIPKVMRESYNSVLETTQNAPKAPAIPGSVPLKNNVYEAYCRYRAQALPRFVAYREALIRQTRGRYKTRDPHVLDVTSERLERKPEIQQRLEYLTNHAIDGIQAKRLALETQLWGMSRTNLADFFEQYQELVTDKNGNPVVGENGAPKVRTRERPRLLTELPPELAALVEDVTIDSKGRAIPKLYNKLQANKELRAMLDIGRSSDGRSDVSRLSDAELVAQLADQAKALGVDIKLDYRFAASHALPSDGAPGGDASNIKDITPRGTLSNKQRDGE